MENLLLFPLRLSFRTERGCFPMQEATTAYRQIKCLKLKLYIFVARRAKLGAFHIGRL